MCGLKEIFEGAGNFCDKKVPCKFHFSIWEKLNLIRFIKTLYKNLSPHPSLRDTFSTREKAFELAFSSINLYFLIFYGFSSRTSFSIFIILFSVSLSSVLFPLTYPRMRLESSPSIGSVFVSAWI